MPTTVNLSWKATDLAQQVFNVHQIIGDGFSSYYSRVRSYIDINTSVSSYNTSKCPSTTAQISIPVPGSLTFHAYTPANIGALKNPKKLIIGKSFNQCGLTVGGDYYVIATFTPITCWQSQYSITKSAPIKVTFEPLNLTLANLSSSSSSSLSNRQSSSSSSSSLRNGSSSSSSSSKRNASSSSSSTSLIRASSSSSSIFVANYQSSSSSYIRVLTSSSSSSFFIVKSSSSSSSSSQRSSISSSSSSSRRNASSSSSSTALINSYSSSSSSSRRNASSSSSILVGATSSSSSSIARMNSSSSSSQVRVNTSSSSSSSSAIRSSSSSSSSRLNTSSSSSSSVQLSSSSSQYWVNTKNNAIFVSGVYCSFLDRNPNESEFNYFYNGLNNKSISSGTFVSVLSTYPEFVKKKRALDLYYTYGVTPPNNNIFKNEIMPRFNSLSGKLTVVDCLYCESYSPCKCPIQYDCTVGQVDLAEQIFNNPEFRTRYGTTVLGYDNTYFLSWATKQNDANGNTLGVGSYYLGAGTCAGNMINYMNTIENPQSFCMAYMPRVIDSVTISCGNTTWQNSVKYDVITNIG